MTENYLAHYGVKGMRWGMRKDRSSNSSTKLTAKLVPSSDFVESRSIMKKPTASLSNEEIKKVTARLGLEQNMSKLRPNALVRGEAAAKRALAVAGTVGGLYAVTQSPLGQKIKSGIISAVRKGRA